MRKKKMEQEIQHLQERRQQDLDNYIKAVQTLTKEKCELEAELRQYDCRVSDTEHWQHEYWTLKDEYDQMVSKLEELVRKYCG